MRFHSSILVTLFLTLLFSFSTSPVFTSSLDPVSCLLHLAVCSTAVESPIDCLQNTFNLASYPLLNVSSADQHSEYDLNIFPVSHILRLLIPVSPVSSSVQLYQNTDYPVSPPYPFPNLVIEGNRYGDTVYDQLSLTHPLNTTGLFLSLAPGSLNSFRFQWRSGDEIPSPDWLNRPGLLVEAYMPSGGDAMSLLPWSSDSPLSFLALVPELDCEAPEWQYQAQLITNNTRYFSTNATDVTHIYRGEVLDFPGIVDTFHFSFPSGHSLVPEALIRVENSGFASGYDEQQSVSFTVPSTPGQAFDSYPLPMPSFPTQLWYMTIDLHLATGGQISRVTYLMVRKFGERWNNTQPDAPLCHLPPEFPVSHGGSGGSDVQPPEHSNDHKVLVAIIGSIGAVLAIGFVAAVCYVKRKKEKSRSNLDDQLYGDGSNYSRTQYESLIN